MAERTLEEILGNLRRRVALIERRGIKDQVRVSTTVASARLALDRALALSAPTELNDLIAAQTAVDRRVELALWTQPRELARAYPLGWHVMLDSHEWESTEQANIWKPGTSGWTQIT